MLAVAIADLPDPDVRLPDRDVFPFGEVTPNRRVRQSKRPHHVVELRLRLDRGVVEIGAELRSFSAVVRQSHGASAKLPPSSAIIATRRDRRARGPARLQTRSSSSERLRRLAMESSRR